jgi:hypothetical protein
MTTKCSPASTTISIVVPPSVTRRVDRDGGHEQPREQRIGTAALKPPTEFHGDVLSAASGVAFVGDLQVATDPLDVGCTGRARLRTPAASTRRGTIVLMASVITAEVATATAAQAVITNGSSSLRAVSRSRMVALSAVYSP